MQGVLFQFASGFASDRGIEVTSTASNTATIFHGRIVALGEGLSWLAMSLQSRRGRMPIVAFILLALVCLALFGFACACLSDHPMQVLERALGAMPALPALVEVWSVLALLGLGMAAVLAAAATARARAPSAAGLQRFLL